MEIALIKSYTNKPWRTPQTYQMLEEGLSQKWHVSSIATHDPEALYSFLTRLQNEHGEQVFAVNVAEYLDEESKGGFLPALLEKWQIPFLGSSAKTTSIELNKARTKEILQAKGVPTPPYFVAKQDDRYIEGTADEIGYPLIVKPVAEGGHIGIGADSIVHDVAELRPAVERIFRDHNQPALVEKYITGDAMREFTVGVIDCEPRLFTPVEIDFDNMDVAEAILSHEVVQNDLEKIKLIDDEALRAEIIDLAERTFDAMGTYDYSRIDMRMDDTGCYVLEINTMPGMGPHSFLPSAARDIYGLSYNDLVQMLVTDSMKRQRLS